MLQRLFLYATLGVLLDALGHQWNTTEFWCFLGLFWAADRLSHMEGYRDAVLGMLEMLQSHRSAVEALEKKLKEMVNGNETR